MLWKRYKDRGARADEILEDLGIYRPPVDVRQLCARLGIHLIEVAAPGWSGALRSSIDSATIWADVAHAEVRKRFTIAHEIGHLMLHPLGEEFRDNTFAGTPREADANRYAADLLMPLMMLRPLAMAHRFDEEMLSRLFHVSRQAMEIRLLKVRGL